MTYWPNTISPSRRWLFLAGALILFSASVFGHQTDFTEVRAVFSQDGNFQVDLSVHADAMLMGLPPDNLNDADFRYLFSLPTEEIERRKEDLQVFFRRTVRLRFDGAIYEPAFAFPEEGAPIKEGQDAKLLGHTVRLLGMVPEGAKEFTFAASRLFGPVVLYLSWEGGEPAVQPLEAGYASHPFSLARPKPIPRLTVAGQYLRVGFLHIVPQGLDHILFVLGLFLLGVRLQPLLWQVTAFTVAHSVTLGLSMYGIVSLPPRVVEPLIALSIAYVAVENLFTSELKPWRPAVVFGFGLLHGLGFASVLTGWDLPKGEFATGLIAFNVGVELGQLTVISGAFLLVGWFRRRPWYRRRIVIPASAAIALVGLYWAVTRVIGG